MNLIIKFDETHIFIKPVQVSFDLGHAVDFQDGAYLVNKANKEKILRERKKWRKAPPVDQIAFIFPLVFSDNCSLKDTFIVNEDIIVMETKGDGSRREVKIKNEKIRSIKIYYQDNSEKIRISYRFYNNRIFILRNRYKNLIVW